MRYLSIAAALPLCLALSVNSAIAQSPNAVPPASPPSQPNATESNPPSEASVQLAWLPGLGQPGSQAYTSTAPVQQSGMATQPTATQPTQGASVTGTANDQAASPIPVADNPAGLQNAAVVPAAFQQPVDPTGGASNLEITKVTSGLKELPNTHGQVWRTYDISPYTRSVQSATRPEQAVIDWILTETGKEMWFGSPMGILSASQDELHVYHTPEIQNRIKPIVDRFVQSQGRPVVVGMRLMTIGSPGWRASAFSMMQPIPVNAPGVEAWLMTKENAAILGNMLRQRADYQEQNNNDLVVTDGQEYSLDRTRPVSFARSVRIVQDGGIPRYEPVVDTIKIGYELEFSALSSLDGRSIEAIVGCEINQIEQLQRVKVDLPTAGGITQPYELQIPQMVRGSFRERFRWPSDMVLVLSGGVVAAPGPQRQALLGIPALVNGTQGRADALMFIEFKGAARVSNNAGPGSATAQAPGSPSVPQR